MNANSGNKTMMLLLAVGGIFILGCLPSQQDNGNDYRAWIAIETDASGIKVDAYGLNNTSQDVVLRYELKAKKTGKAGRAQTSQSGSVEVPAGQKEHLSRLDLGVSAEDRYQIDLKVYKDVELVAEDSVSYPQQR